MSATLEILAPYLPYGIRVASQWTDGNDNTTGALLGINTTAERPVAWNDGEYNYASSYGNVLPILRAFADLCIPLADGTVPAREVGRIMLAGKQPFGRTIDFPSDGIFMQSGSIRVNAFLVDRDSNNVGAIQLLIDHNYEFEIEDHSGVLRHGNLVAAYNYLRSKHFAVGLEPHQYIRKTN